MQTAPSDPEQSAQRRAHLRSPATPLAGLTSYLGVNVTTPTPADVANTNDQTPAPAQVLNPMVHAEKMRFRQAAHRAMVLHSGIIGEVLAAELLAWEELGYRLGTGGRMHRLVEHLLATPPPSDHHG